MFLSLGGNIWIDVVTWTRHGCLWHGTCINSANFI